MKFLALILTYLICLNSFAAPSMGVTGQNQSPAKYPSVVKAPNNQVTDLGASSVLMENGNKNRLINPGFEHSTFTTGWTTSVTSTATITPVVNTATPIEGKKSAQYTCAGGASGGVCTIYQDATTSYAVQGNAGVYVKTDTVYDGVNLKGPKIWSRVNGVNSQSKNIDSAIKWWEIPVTLGTTSTGVAIEITVAASQTIVVTLDEAFVGAEALRVNGAIVTEWTAFTPVISGSTSNPTRATGATEKAYWRRVGDSMEITYFYTQSASTGAVAGSGNYLWGLPSGYTIDTNKIANNNGGSLVVGSARVFNGSGSAWYEGTVFPYSTTQLALLVQGSTFATGNTVGTGWVPFTNASAIEYSYSAKVPIVGWGSASSTYSSTNANTDWVSCGHTTSSFVGLGTVTAIETHCKRDGGDILMKGKFTTGATTATEARISLPVWYGTQIVSKGTSVIPSTQIAGKGTHAAASASFFSGITTIIEPSVSYITLGLEGSSNNGLVKINGTALFSATSTSFHARIPIEGWDNSNVIIGQFNGLESCTDSYQCTDTFSINTVAAGTTSRERLDWINGNPTVSTGVYTYTLNNGLFGGGANITQPMNCGAEPISNSSPNAAVECTVTSSSTTQVAVRCSQGGTNLNWDHVLWCDKQGADYIGKTAKAVASDQNVRAPGITNSIVFGADITSTGTISNNDENVVSSASCTTGNWTVNFTGTSKINSCYLVNTSASNYYTMRAFTRASATQVTFTTVDGTPAASCTNIRLECRGTK